LQIGDKQDIVNAIVALGGTQIEAEATANSIHAKIP
jgi:hypothetical protein